MNVEELMTTEVSIVDLGTSVADAAAIMQSENTGCIVVVDVVEDGAVAGIITERDMVLGCLIDGHNSRQCQVFNHMTAMEEAATPNTDVGEALLTMIESEVSYLPVIGIGGAVMGLLYAEDLSLAIEQDDSPISVVPGDLISV